MKQALPLRYLVSNLLTKQAAARESHSRRMEGCGLVLSLLMLSYAANMSNCKEELSNAIKTYELVILSTHQVVSPFRLLANPSKVVSDCNKYGRLYSITFPFHNCTRAKSHNQVLLHTAKLGSVAHHTRLS